MRLFISSVICLSTFSSSFFAFVAWSIASVRPLKMASSCCSIVRPFARASFSAYIAFATLLVLTKYVSALFADIYSLIDFAHSLTSAALCFASSAKRFSEFIAVPKVSSKRNFKEVKAWSMSPKLFVDTKGVSASFCLKAIIASILAIPCSWFSVGIAITLARAFLAVAAELIACIC